jgi:hypothetical protein
LNRSRAGFRHADVQNEFRAGAGERGGGVLDGGVRRIAGLDGSRTGGIAHPRAVKSRTDVMEYRMAAYAGPCVFRHGRDFQLGRGEQLERLDIVSLLRAPDAVEHFGQASPSEQPIMIGLTELLQPLGGR